ncbi:MAG: PLP-dependent cysteine synthase family protein, partial [Bradyrhizobium sp.]|nr:PLP-dependent cysteine synthase family protein [Bradyrhizobium sp.]
MISPPASRASQVSLPRYRRVWVDDAVAAIEADQCRTADTHLIRLIVPAL